MTTSVWRIAHKNHATTAFSGEGSRYGSGKWQKNGKPIVYTSATLSLAALELLVNMEVESVGNIFVSVRADIPEDMRIEEVNVHSLPGNWRDMPAPRFLTNIGDQWLTNQNTAILAVPSALIAHEKNFLINPNHPDFARIVINPPQPFWLEPRKNKKLLPL
jgi:RES domain-containing protein